MYYHTLYLMLVFVVHCIDIEHVLVMELLLVCCPGNLSLKLNIDDFLENKIKIRLINKTAFYKCISISDKWEGVSFMHSTNRYVQSIN